MQTRLGSSLPSIEEAKERYFPLLSAMSASAERIPITEALGRVTAAEVFSGVDVPNFSRSSMDGYAVQSASLRGASEESPITLELVGEVAMGAAAEVVIGAGQAAYIATGGMLPEGADSVVMVEYTEQVGNDRLKVTRSVEAGENLVFSGEDIRVGELLLPVGLRLRPQDIGAMAAIGCTEVEVYPRPRVGILPTGDEVVDITDQLKPGQVRNSNAYALAAAVAEDGGIPIVYPVVGDDEQLMLQRLKEALAEVDMLIITGGSSAGKRDFTPDAVAQLGEPGVIVHGIAVKPGKPTLLGLIDEKPILGLPGNPVSALVIYQLFGRPILHKRMGYVDMEPHQATIEARLTREVRAPASRDELVRVRLVSRNGETWAEPVSGKSALIVTLVRSHGLFRLDRGEQRQVGEQVTVFPFHGSGAEGA